jgi:hydrogenase expression/formation protein HypC
MCLAIPAKVIGFSSDEENRALVDVAGVRRYIDTGLLEDDPPQTGDWVLVHVGFAMSKVSEADALDQIRTLKALGESDAARNEAEQYGAPDREDFKKAQP